MADAKPPTTGLIIASVLLRVVLFIVVGVLGYTIGGLIGTLVGFLFDIASGPPTQEPGEFAVSWAWAFAFIGAVLGAVGAVIWLGVAMGNMSGHASWPEWIRRGLNMRTRGVRRVAHYISCADSASVEVVRRKAEAAGFDVSVQRLDDPLVYVISLAHEADPDLPGYQEGVARWGKELAAEVPAGHYDGLGYEWGYGGPPDVGAKG